MLGNYLAAFHKSGTEAVGEWTLSTKENRRNLPMGPSREYGEGIQEVPVPSSTRLSTEAQHGFQAHGFTSDQSSPLAPTPNPIPGPVLEGFMDEPPLHSDPVPGFVQGGLMDEPPPHPNPVLVLFRRGPKPSRPHTLVEHLVQINTQLTDA
ncbi:hypothetical protein AMECASPLE_032155 [Ameca splendens]|uniref:Uncharacterized protein n=1 Tax=Ameca splendens TaxID=208324 RepID=A0ABV1A425_9TELE